MKELTKAIQKKETVQAFASCSCSCGNQSCTCTGSAASASSIFTSVNGTSATNLKSALYG